MGHKFLDILDQSWVLCLTWLPVDGNISQSWPAILLKKLPIISLTSCGPIFIERAEINKKVTILHLQLFKFTQYCPLIYWTALFISLQLLWEAIWNCSCGCLHVVFGCSKFVRIPQVNEHFHAQLELPQGSRPWPCHFDRRGLHCGRRSFSGDICFGQELPSLKLLTRMCTCLITLHELHPTQR